jgi:MFS family permease
VASVVYVVVVATTFMIVPPEKPSAVNKAASFFKDFIDGFRYMLVENRTILALIVIAMGPLAFAYSYINLLPVFVTKSLNMGPSIFGLLQSIAAVGALVGGLGMASMSNVRHKGRIMVITGASYGIAVTAIGVLPFPVVAFVLVIVIGASQTIFRTANNGSLLELTPPGLQGRVVSATFVDMGVQSLAALMAGVVTDQWGVGAGMAVLGGLCLIIVLAIWLGVPSIRRV